MIDEKLRLAVAKAICAAMEDDWQREGPGDVLMEAYGPLADAAIAALSDHIPDTGQMVPGSTGSAEGWQDISTAPKDGTPFFGIGPEDAYPQPMRWQAYPDEEAEEIGEPGYWAYCEDLIGDVTGSATPTYWRRMFERPSAMLSAAGGENA